ncbi:gamma-crystallin S-1-like [Engraulis encrasicolus]|uniref:gamma-crystallin S-1-like n=1 Tax=Engraulis encrasicolus TaxID=184585 RepID=UPI002FD021A2
MGKIIFFEDKHFAGQHYECSSDCKDLYSCFRQCNSIKVESGCFMIYESPNYTGQQYFVCPGEYPEFHKWMGINDHVCSCRMIPQDSKGFKLSFFERTEFGGQMRELTDNCPNLMDCFNTGSIFSCKVREGNWLFYEHPEYQGRMYLMMPGEYCRFSEWGGASARVGSIKCILTY